MIKLVVFDLDGTLIDSLPSIAHALEATLHEYGYPQVGLENTRNWIGDGSDTLVARAMSNRMEVNPNLPINTLNDARRYFNKVAQAVGHEHDKLYPNVKCTLEKLSERGFKMAILSNKTECLIEPILAHFGILSFFNSIVAGNTLPERKPSPMGLKWLANKHAVELNEVLMVGDSRNDILPATQSGAYSVGMTYGYNYGNPISDSNPDHVLNHFDDLLMLSELMTEC